MRDPSTRDIRQPTQRERDRTIVSPTYGRSSARWANLDVGDRVTTYRTYAYEGRTWLRRHGRDGEVLRMDDGFYRLVRTV